MNEEQLLTFDSVQELLSRTKARRNRLNSAKDETPSYTSSSSSTIKSVSGRGSPLKAVNSNGSLISNIPFVDDASSVVLKKSETPETKSSSSSVSVISDAQENPGPLSSILKNVEEDLPRYKVEIKSRFSPTKKPSAPAYRPSPSKFNKPADVRVSSIALPMPTKAAATKVEPKPCRIASGSKIAETVKTIEEEKIDTKVENEKKFEIPESAPISTRIKDLQKLFGSQNQEPESPAPERLPVFAKKRLFERKIKEEQNLAQEGIKRNEYLAQKRGLSSTDISAQSSNHSGDFTHALRPSVAGMVGNGKVQKMLEKLASPDPHNKSNEDEEPRAQRNPRASRVSFKLPSPSESSALGKFDDIDKISETNSDTFSPASVPDVYLGRSTRGDNYSDDDMELDSQSSQDGSPRKSLYYVRERVEDDAVSQRSSISNSLYPSLPTVEEADSVHSSPSKRTRFQDDQYDDDRFTSSGEAEVSRHPSSTSIPLHEAIEKAVNEKLGTPMRTLSQYRLEQKKKAQTDTAVVPQIVYGTMKRDERKDALAENERRSRIQHMISQLKNVEVPKYETMIEQASNLLNHVKPTNCGSEAHADSERHLKVLGLKRIAAMNEAHRLHTMLETGAKAPTDFVTGCIHFDRIDIPIDHELRLAYSHGLATKQNINQYYFVAVSYSGVVHASDCRTLKDGIASEFLSFKLPHGLKICGVRHDFEVKIEVYGWSVVDEKSHCSKGMTLKSKLTPKKSNKQKLVASPGGPMAIRTSQFTLRGSLTLTHKNLLKKKQSLTELNDKSLNGMIDLQVKLEPEFKKSYSNFLHFYEDSDGSWRRRWVKLEGHLLKYWLTPEAAERGEEPLNEIDMKLCVNPYIGRLTTDICPRKNSFSLILASYPDKTANRVNYILNKNYSSINRMFVAADVSEDCDEWIDQIASLIQGMRLWDPQALRSCSMADFDRYLRAN